MAQITNEALNSLSEKLKSFTEGLSEDERTVMQALIEEATSDDDVAGFDFSKFSTVLPSFTFEPAKLDARLSSRLGVSSSDDGHTGYWSLDIPSGSKSLGGRGL